LGEKPSPSEAVKKTSSPVIPSEARNLHLFVFKELNADASLRSARQTIFSHLLGERVSRCQRFHQPVG